MASDYGSQPKMQPKFINFELIRRDEEPFRAWKEANKEKLWDFIDQMVDSGYKFTLGHDQKYGCPVVNMMCVNQKSPNYTGLMASRAETVEEALWISLYKHYEMLKEEWPLGSDSKWG